MNRLDKVSAIALALAALVPGLSARGDETVPSGRIARIYTATYFDLIGYREMIAGQCEVYEADCEIDYMGRANRIGSPGYRYIQVLATEAMHDRIAAYLAEHDVPPPSQIFRVLILEASLVADPGPSLPQDVRQALDEVRPHLSYAGFHLLHQAVIRTTRSAGVTLGDEKTGFEASLRFTGRPAEGETLAVESFTLRARARKPGEESSRGEVLLGTSFTIEAGETIVLGTSELAGDGTGLVVLVTAISR